MDQHAPMLPSRIIKRSVELRGHKTSVSMEEIFWKQLKQEAIVRDVTLGWLIDQIDQMRMHGNLSSACRCHVLEYNLEQLNACRQRQGQ